MLHCLRAIAMVPHVRQHVDKLQGQSLLHSLVAMLGRRESTFSDSDLVRSCKSAGKQQVALDRPELISREAVQALEVRCSPHHGACLYGFVAGSTIVLVQLPGSRPALLGHSLDPCGHRLGMPCSLALPCQGVCATTSSCRQS